MDNFFLESDKGSIKQLKDGERIKVVITDPKLLKKYSNVYVLPIDALDYWIKVLDITQTPNGAIALSEDWRA